MFLQAQFTTVFSALVGDFFSLQAQCSPSFGGIGVEEVWPLLYEVIIAAGDAAVIGTPVERILVQGTILHAFCIHVLDIKASVLANLCDVITLAFVIGLT